MAAHPPLLRRVLRVVPVAQTREHGGWALTCIAVEAYDDGFRATFRVYRAGAGAVTPALPAAATDDRGGRYRAWPGGGTGLGPPPDCDWRLSVAFAPALDPAARELRLAIPELQEFRLDEARRRLVSEVIQTGPWTFLVPLAADQGGGGRP